ncbi:MAG: aspartyl protease family protein [Saprospiraceae bacterium]
MLFAQHSAFVLASGVRLNAEESALSIDTDSQSAKLIRRGGLLLVNGSLGDKQNGWFILDTGSPGLLINDPSISEKGADGTIGGATGQTPFQVLQVSKLQVAGLTQSNISALALDLSFTEEHLDLKILGVIGFAQLKDFPVHVSLSQNSLCFGESRNATTSKTMLAQYDFELAGHLPILEASIGGQALDFVFDTGSGVNVIDEAYFESMEDNMRGRPASRTFAGIDNNPTQVPCALLRSIQLKERVHTDRPFLFANLADVQAEVPSVAGLLGPAFWKSQSFTIDYLRSQLTAYK